MDKNMQYVLGVDGGNTKTVALLARPDGRIVGAGRGGCGDIYKGVDDALSSLDQAIEQARKQADCKAKRMIAAAGFSLAGADWPEDFALLRKRFRHRRYGAKLIVVNDAIGAVRADFANDWGVAVACGTGAATGARSKDGTRVWHSSFWQLGGASVMLGAEAIESVHRAELGLIPQTVLTERVLAHYKLPNVERLLHSRTRRLNPMPKRADRLARIVLDAAHEGDHAALQIVREEAVRLGDTAIVAAGKVGIGDEPFPLALIGSVFRHDCKLLAKLVGRHVRKRLPNAQAHLSESEPSAGALVIALEAAGVQVDDQVRANIRSTFPPRSFFAT
jgi:N-acetylglucosamine kinase-like BadF-type ATPase